MVYNNENIFLIFSFFQFSSHLLYALVYKIKMKHSIFALEIVKVKGIL